MNNNTGNINIMTEDAIREKYLKWNTAKLLIAKLAAIAMIVTALFLSWSVLDPKQKDPMRTVYDEGEILSDATIESIERKNSALYELTGEKAQIFVIVEKKQNNYNDLMKTADKLFKDYKLSPDSILFVVSAPSKTDSGSSGFFAEIGESIREFFADLFGGGSQPYAYHKGRNLEHFSDSKIDEIFSKNFVEIYNGEDGNYNGAVLNTFNALAGYFEEAYNINIQHYLTPPTPPEPPEAPGFLDRQDTNRIATVLGIAFLFVIIFIILGSLTRKKNAGASRVYRKPLWFN